MRRRTFWICLLTTCVVALSASTALASINTTQDGYVSQGVQQQVTTAPAKKAAKPSAAGTMPMTGFDLYASVGVGVVLLGLGLWLRRLALHNSGRNIR